MSGPLRFSHEGALLAMQRAFDRINTSGGVCGRRIELIALNDSGSDEQGRALVRRLANDVLALVAMPSEETLDAAIRNGDIDAAEIPVVGTQGTQPSEFRSPWVWPLGPPASLFADVTARDVYERGARRLALIWDPELRFAVEARRQILSVARRLPGVEVVVDQRLERDQPSYSAEVNAYNDRCEGTCDATFLLLLPGPARQWVGRTPSVPRVGTIVPPYLLSNEFAQSCGNVDSKACVGIEAWTGLRAPIPPREDPYSRDAKAAKIDGLPVQTEAAWLAAFLVAEALGRVGPAVTRERLKDVLDSESFESSLTARPLTWRRSRAANHAMRSYAPVYSAGVFRGWQERRGWRGAVASGKP